mmetsp:Transcript_38201/g.107949  ORF Transcript_38201/g.107949 Transcript_38201/m.107949 type:complete len:423 (-) Transcript_38201:370-1638(-)
MFRSQLSPAGPPGSPLSPHRQARPGFLPAALLQRSSPLQTRSPKLFNSAPHAQSGRKLFAALNEAPPTGAQAVGDQGGGPLWWFEGWREKAERELQAAVDAEAVAQAEYSAAAEKAAQLRTKADEAGQALSQAAAGVDWKARLDAGRVASEAEKDATVAEALATDLGEVLNSAALWVASARETCQVASVALAGQKDDAVEEAARKGVKSSALASDSLPWFEDWKRRAEEELQAALDAEASLRREHEAAAERVSQLLSKADEAESNLKKAAAGVDWKARLEAGRMASAADKVTKQAEEEFAALNMALSEASARVQSAEETRKVAAATLDELRSVEEDTHQSFGLWPTPVAAEGLAYSSLTLDALPEQPNYSQELNGEKTMFNDVMAELERAMQECAAAEEELLQELEQLKAARAAKGTRLPQC